MIRFFNLHTFDFLCENNSECIWELFLQSKLLVVVLLALLFSQSSVVLAQDRQDVNYLKLKPKPFLYQNFQNAKLNSEIPLVKNHYEVFRRKVNYNSLAVKEFLIKYLDGLRKKFESDPERDMNSIFDYEIKVEKDHIKEIMIRNAKEVINDDLKILELKAAIEYSFQ